MKLLILIAVSLFGFCNAAIVNIPGLGQLQGTTETTAWTKRSYHAFMGIRFAKAPSGPRRFLPPEPVDPWSGILDATKMGIACPQLDNPLPISVTAPPPNVDIEDCLMLNVYTPTLPGVGAKPLPVMVYIHGGGFMTGSAHAFKGDYLMEHDIVLVAIQYRLGTLGMLSLDTDGIPGNAGFIDQVAALRWVNKYINNFGGDNTQVTIFGESAGGGSCNYLLLSPIVEPYLFQKVIIQSGAAHAHWGFEKKPRRVAESLYRILTNSNVTADLATMEQKFKQVSVRDLFDAANKNTGMKNGEASRAVAQTAGSIKYFTKSPTEYLDSGEYQTKPMIIGAVKHEGSYRTPWIYDKLKAKGLHNNAEFLRNNLTKMVLELPLIEITDTSDSMIEILNYLVFRKLFEDPRNLTYTDMVPGVTDLVSIFLMKGQILKTAKANSRYKCNDTYFYTFDYEGEHSNFGHGHPERYPFKGGVTHSNDLIYLFPLFDLNPTDTKVAQLTTDLWTSFAIGNKPTSPLLKFDWPPMNRYQNGPYLHLTLNPTLGTNFVSNEFTIMSLDEKKL